MKKIGIVALLGSFMVLGGCANAINDSRFGDNPLKKTPEGFSYKVFTIEGCKYIGTQDEDKVWYLAGPSSCSKQVQPGLQDE